jgi:hypothetical protein
LLNEREEFIIKNFLLKDIAGRVSQNALVRRGNEKENFMLYRRTYSKESIP